MKNSLKILTLAWMLGFTLAYFFHAEASDQSPPAAPAPVSSPIQGTQPVASPAAGASAQASLAVEDWGEIIPEDLTPASAEAHTVFVTFLKKVKLEQGFPKEQTGILKSCFQKISKGRIGRRLLASLTALLDGRNIMLRVSSQGRHLFSPPSSQSEGKDDATLFIDIDPTKTSESTRVGTFGPVSVPNASDSLATASSAGTPTSFYPVGGMSYDFCFVLAHELIHLLHFLTDADDYFRHVGRPADRKLWPIYETAERARRLWLNREEQRTVIGLPDERGRMDPEQISEASILIEHGINPRYAYQRHDEYFYEERDVIQSIFSFLLHPEAPLLARREWEFPADDDREALERPRASLLNPAALQEANQAFIKAQRAVPLIGMNLGDEATRRRVAAKQAAMDERMAARRAGKK